MFQYNKLRILAGVWGTVLLSIALVYWMFLAPQDNSKYHAPREACSGVQLGMSLQQTLDTIEMRANPSYESLDEGKLLTNFCTVTFENNKVTHVDAGFSLFNELGR